MLRSVYEDSQTSEGSAQQELDKYLDSIEGKITQLTNRIQEFWDTTIDSDAVKTIVDVLSNIVQLGTELMDIFGPMPVLVTGIVTALNKFTGGGRAKNFICYHKKVNYR